MNLGGLARWRHVTALVVWAVVSALSLGGTAEARSLAEIRASGKIYLCVAGSSAPFYQTNGEAFARYLGVSPIVRKLADWDRQFHNAEGVTVKEAAYESKLLADGECDVFPNDLHVTDWRRSKMAMVPYYSTRKVVVAGRDMRAIVKQPRDLAGHTVAVQKGTAYEAWLNEQNVGEWVHDPVRITLVATEMAMRQVSEGGAEFTVIGAEAAFKWVRGDLQNLDLLFPVGESTEVAWGVRPSARDLQDELGNFFAASMRVGSDLDRSWQRQYGISLMEYRLFEASFDAGGFDFRTILAWVIPVGSGAAGLLLAMLFWNRRLKREIENHRRTEAALLASQERIAKESQMRLAVSQISLELQRADSLEALARALLSGLGRNLPLGQGLFCVWDEYSGSLKAIAHYAGDAATPAGSLDRFSSRGGLLDRCIHNREVVRVDNPDGTLLRLRSGLGDQVPSTVLIYPIQQVDKLKAVLEIATTSPLLDEHFELLKNLEAVIALALAARQSR